MQTIDEDQTGKKQLLSGIIKLRKNPQIYSDDCVHIVNILIERILILCEYVTQHSTVSSLPEGTVDVITWVRSLTNDDITSISSDKIKILYETYDKLIHIVTPVTFGKCKLIVSRGNSRLFDIFGINIDIFQSIVTLLLFLVLFVTLLTSNMVSFNKPLTIVPSYSMYPSEANHDIPDSHTLTTVTNSPQVLYTEQSKQNGIRIFMNLAFSMTIAGMGASFLMLYNINRGRKFYFAVGDIVEGIASGLILSDILFPLMFHEVSQSSFAYGKFTLAFFGGMTSEFIFNMLNYIQDKLGQIFRPDTKSTDTMK